MKPTLTLENRFQLFTSLRARFQKITMDPITTFITWTTYGTWLPGDMRGWRHSNRGNQSPRPLLEKWCREQMTSQIVTLSFDDRKMVELACVEHCKHRQWILLAANARSNHVHVVIEANERPQKVRDQLKANCTRKLRQQNVALRAKRTWTRGGDCSILKSDSDIDNAISYVNDAQDF